MQKRFVALREFERLAEYAKASGKRKLADAHLRLANSSEVANAFARLAADVPPRAWDSRIAFAVEHALRAALYPSKSREERLRSFRASARAARKLATIVRRGNTDCDAFAFIPPDAYCSVLMLTGAVRSPEEARARVEDEQRRGMESASIGYHSWQGLPRFPMLSDIAEAFASLQDQWAAKALADKTLPRPSAPNAARNVCVRTLAPAIREELGRPNHELVALLARVALGLRTDQLDAAHVTEILRARPTGRSRTRAATNARFRKPRSV